MTGASFAAVDLGASSGRVMLASCTSDGLALREVHRFVNRPTRVAGTLYWDALALWAGIVDGLRIAARVTDGLASIGVDSWAVDYALLDVEGRLLGNPVHYRDTRTEGIAEMLARSIPPAEHYAITGICPLPFNTIFQWMAESETTAARAAACAVPISDLINYWLTGYLGWELTNASTTGLLDIRTQQWSDDVCMRAGLRRELLGTIHRPGDAAGLLRTDVAMECDLDAVPVTAVGSHDTASAVVGVPAVDHSFAYISCGTWSLVGVELDQPVTSEAALSAGFSNELGVDGTVRFLRNIPGMWLLQESVRMWQRNGGPVNLDQLLAEAAALPARRSRIDVNLDQFLPPGDMPERIRAECRRTDQAVPQTPAEIARCILDSLALAYRRAIDAAQALTGLVVDRIHLVGGGAHNALLCQLTADECERTVIAGPTEAAAFGNTLIQARAAGSISGTLQDLRAQIPSDATAQYQPRVRP